MRNIRICAVVTGKTKEEFLRNLEMIQREADLVELRVDYIDGFSINDIGLIKRKSYGADCKSAPAKIKYIFTCRKKEEGGFFNGKESERIEILKKALEIGFDYVDIELATAEEFDFGISLGTKFFFAGVTPPQGGVEHSSSKKNCSSLLTTKIILSFHDFEKTPTLAELEEIKKQMKKYSPDIMKFATLVKNEEESKMLFKFLLDKKDDEEMIVVGMGEKGRVTRVVAPLLGSYLTYASNENSKSAEGQIEIQELKKLYNRIVKLLNC